MASLSVKRHLKELQWRLMIVAAFFIAGACLAYTYQEQLIPALLAPLHGEKLVYLNPAGGFSFIFLISIYAGIAVALPILVQQIYAFLRPALPAKAQKKSSGLIIGSFMLLISGIAFGYFVAVPSALTFLYSFADQYVSASLTADSYLNFVIAYTIGIGLVFQLPLLLLLVHSIKPLTPGGLMKSERWVILVAFIIAAIITPTPDPINQAIIAGPVVVVYQIGVTAILISVAKARRKAKRQTKQLQQQAARQQKALAKAPAPVRQPQPVLAAAAQPVRAAQTVQQPRPAAHAPIQLKSHTQALKPSQTQRPRTVDGFVHNAKPVQQLNRHSIVVPQRTAQVQRPVRPMQPMTKRQPLRQALSMDGMAPQQQPTASYLSQFL